MLGIDVSMYQEDIDWEKVSYIDFVSIKAGGGDQGIYTDPKFIRNATLSKNKYKQFYWYLSFDEDYKAQVKYFKDLCVKYPHNILPVLDVEHPAISRFDYNLKTYLNEIYPYAVEIFGNIMINYSAAWWLNPRLTTIGSYPSDTLWWIAAYSSKILVPNKMLPSQIVAWQKSETGRIDGIKGNVDIDEILNLEKILYPTSSDYETPSEILYIGNISQEYKEVNFRKSPEIKSDNIITSLKAGDSIEVLDEENGWSNVKKTIELTGYVRSDLIVKPKVEPTPPKPDPIPPKPKKILIGFHDFPSEAKGYPLMISYDMNKKIEEDLFKRHFESGSDIYLRCSWNYDWPSCPKDSQQIKDMASYYSEVIGKIGKYLKGIHIFNEPNLEIFPFGMSPEYLGTAHNIISEEIRKVSNIKISPAPLAWYAGVFKPNTWELIKGLETPDKVAKRFFDSIDKKYRDLYIAHTYSFGADQNPDEKFRDYPMTSYYRSIRNIENQFDFLKSYGYGDVDVFIGETNMFGDTGFNGDFSTTWFKNTREYFSKFPQITGAAFFRWNTDKVGNKDYTISNKPMLLKSMENQI